MSIITLFNDDRVTLASERLILSADEISGMQTVMQHADTLQTLALNEEARVAQAEANGYEGGYEKGQSEGYEAALEHIAFKLVALAKEANEVRDRIEGQSASLALKIVEKIAEDIGPADTVAALAASAARQLVPREPVVLRVHPNHEQYLKEKIAGSTEAFKQIVEISPDLLLEETDCVLETEFGQIKASLDIQIRVFREKFHVV